MMLVLFLCRQMLASHFQWVHDILERQGRDGKEAVWRTVAEGVAPETINLTDSLGHKYVYVHTAYSHCMCMYRWFALAQD